MRASRPSVGLSVAATLFSLLFFEGATRALGVHFPAVPVAAGTRDVAWTHDPRLGWRNRPHFVGYDYHGGPDGAAVRINSLGLRGAEPGARDETRVAVFGGSFVFGTGVQRPELHWDFGTDRHWNRAAHRLAAEVVDNYLRITGWVGG